MKLRSIVKLIAGATALAVATLAAPTPVQAQAPSGADVVSTDDQSGQYIVRFKAGANRGALLKAVGVRFGISLTDQRELAVGGHVITVEQLLGRRLASPC